MDWNEFIKQGEEIEEISKKLILRVREVMSIDDEIDMWFVANLIERLTKEGNFTKIHEICRGIIPPDCS
jgi:hypothetical protein